MYPSRIARKTSRSSFDQNNFWFTIKLIKCSLANVAASEPPWPIVCDHMWEKEKEICSVLLNCYDWFFFFFFFGFWFIYRRKFQWMHIPNLVRPINSVDRPPKRNLPYTFVHLDYNGQSHVNLHLSMLAFFGRFSCNLQFSLFDFSHIRRWKCSSRNEFSRLCCGPSKKKLVKCNYIKIFVVFNCVFLSLFFFFFFLLFWQFNSSRFSLAVFSYTRMNIKLLFFTLYSTNLESSKWHTQKKNV